MRLRAAIFLILGGLGTWGILHAQKPFLSYESTEDHAVAPLPPDWERQAEWTRGRLKYTSSTFEHPLPKDTFAGLTQLKKLTLDIADLAPDRLAPLTGLDELHVKLRVQNKDWTPFVAQLEGSSLRACELFSFGAKMNLVRDGSGKLVPR